MTRILRIIATGTLFTALLAGCSNMSSAAPGKVVPQSSTPASEEEPKTITETMPQPHPVAIEAPTINGVKAPAPMHVDWPGVTPLLYVKTEEAAQAVALNFYESTVYAGVTWDAGLTKFLMSKDQNSQALKRFSQFESDTMQKRYINIVQKDRANLRTEIDSQDPNIMKVYWTEVISSMSVYVTNREPTVAPEYNMSIGILLTWDTNRWYITEFAGV